MDDREIVNTAAGVGLLLWFSQFSENTITCIVGGFCAIMLMMFVFWGIDDELTMNTINAYGNERVVPWIKANLGGNVKIQYDSYSERWDDNGGYYSDAPGDMRRTKVIRYKCELEHWKGGEYGEDIYVTLRSYHMKSDLENKIPITDFVVTYAYKPTFGSECDETGNFSRLKHQIAGEDNYEPE